VRVELICSRVSKVVFFLESWCRRSIHENAGLSHRATPIHGGSLLALTDVIAQIDAEIAKLQQAKVLLSGAEAPAAPKVKGRRGRPKGSKNTTILAAAAPVAAKKRKLSPEGRKAIADAMKRRWAERRKQAGK